MGYEDGVFAPDSRVLYGFLHPGLQLNRSTRDDIPQGQELAFNGLYLVHDRHEVLDIDLSRHGLWVMLHDPFGRPRPSGAVEPALTDIRVPAGVRDARPAVAAASGEDSGEADGLLDPSAEHALCFVSLTHALQSLELH